MTTEEIALRHQRDDAAGRLTIGSHARICMPNWNGPGAIRYTIKTIDIEHATITMCIPDIPGGAGATVPEWQVVAA